ncbi:sensor histidine kinase [Arthrobacter sp. TMN-37]
MDRASTYLSFNPEQFERLSPRRRMLLSQVPLTATALILLAGVAVFAPALLQGPLLQLSMLMHLLLLVLCAAIPWGRLPLAATLAIPVLEFVPIALMREAAGTEFTALGFLAVFPVIWLTASGIHPRAAILTGVAATLAVVWLPQFLRGPVTPDELARPMLVPIMMLAIGVTVSAITEGFRAQRRILEGKDAELRSLLKASALRERLLHTVVNAVDVGVLAVDSSGREMLANEKQRHLLPATTAPDGAVRGEAATAMFQEDGVTALPPEKRPVRRAVEGEIFSEEIVRIGDGRDQKTLSASAARMKSDDGRHDGTVVTFSDVTELMSALSAKQAFISNITHELRTPLTSIVGYVEMLSSVDGAPAPMVAGLDVVSRNAQRLLGLVNDLLGTADGPTALDPSPIDFVQVVSHAIASATPRAIEAGTALETELADGLQVVCDPGKIGQVLDNLISNAIKYSPRGGTVTVRAHSEDGRLVCTVADTGMGMSEADCRSVFTRFFRSPDAVRAAIPGVGLGLAIVKEIIDQHDGGIECESRLGEGTAITFCLPLEQHALSRS